MARPRTGRGQAAGGPAGLRRREFVAGLGAVAAMGPFVWARGARAQAPKEVLIGAAYPLTGPLAVSGKDSVAALHLAADLVNNRHDVDLPLARGEGLPNLGGAKVRIVVANHQSNTAIVLGEVERLITQEKVHALTGAFESSMTAVASQVAERFGIPMLTGESSSPTLTARGFKWYFRTGPHDVMFTEAMFKFIRDVEKKFNVKMRTAALLWENTLFGTDSAKVERNLLQQAGIRIVEDLSYKANATSLTSEIQRLKAADPDILFPTSYANDAILMLRTARELDYNPKLVLAQDSGHTMAAFLDTVKAEADGISSRNVWADDLVSKFPQVGYLGELYKKHSGGRVLTEIPIRSMVGALVLADGINRAGSVEPERIRQALKETDIPARMVPMPWRGIKFDETQQNHLVEAIITQIQGGRHWTVWPFELAAKEAIYPIPKWSERKR